MGKVTLFTVRFQKPNPIYLAGETVNGIVIVKIAERLKINSASVAVIGYAYVHWSESHGSGKDRHTVHRRAREEYLNFQVPLITKAASNGGDLFVEVGEWSFPFSFALPFNIPSNFESGTGVIRYQANATLDIPWAFDKHSSKSFVVVSHYDLNKNPTLNQPYGINESKVLGCLCCKSDPIQINCSIMKIGFVSGEAVQFKADVQNRSKSEFRRCEVMLKQTVTFHAGGHTRHKKETLARQSLGRKIGPLSSENWLGSLPIPPVISSSNGTCRIIEISYSLVFAFNPEGLSLCIELTIPLVIGTIPIMLQNQTAPPMTFETYNAGVDRLPNPDVKGEFMESDEKTFKPIYPYYKDFSTPINA